MFFTNKNISNSIALQKNYFTLVDKVLYIIDKRYKSAASRALVMQINQELILLSDLFYHSTEELSDSELDSLLKKLWRRGKVGIAEKYKNITTIPQPIDQRRLVLPATVRTNPSIARVSEAVFNLKSGINEHQPTSMNIERNTLTNNYNRFELSCLRLMAEVSKSKDRIITEDMVEALAYSEHTKYMHLYVPFWNPIEDTLGVLSAVASTDHVCFIEAYYVQTTLPYRSYMHTFIPDVTNRNNRSMS
jgi:type IV secretory pathway VirB4 component